MANRSSHSAARPTPHGYFKVFGAQRCREALRHRHRPPWRYPSPRWRRSPTDESGLPERLQGNSARRLRAPTDLAAAVRESREKKFVLGDAKV